MYKLVITNGWSDLNAGDSAIVMSVVKRFHMEYGDKLSVTVLSELSQNNPFFEDSIDMVKQVFPSVDLGLVPSPFKKLYSRSLTNKIFEILSFMQCLLMLPFSRFQQNKYIKSIKNADVIVSKGGHFIYDRRGVHSVVHLIKCLYPMVLAKLFDKKYIFLAQSFGPFYSDTLLSRFNSKLVKYILNNSQGVSVREEVSFGALKKMGIKNEILFNTSDYAFLLNDIEFNNAQKNYNNNYFVVTLRQHNFKSINGEERYLSTIKYICLEIYNKYGLTPLIVPHVKGPNDFENDLIITKKFEKQLTYSESLIFSFNYQCRHAKEFAELYSNARILIGTRFHSVIFALCRQVPSFAISYSGYKVNILRQFDMDEFMMDIEDVNSENYQFLANKLFKLIEDNSNYRVKIATKLNQVRDSILRDPVFNRLSC